MLKPRTKITLPLFQVTGMLALFLTGWVAAKLAELRPLPDQEGTELAELWDAFADFGGAVRNKANSFRAELPTLRRSRSPAALEQLESEAQEWLKWLDGKRQQTRLTDTEPAKPDRPQSAPASFGMDQLAPVRLELLSLLDRVVEASSNYYFAARYLGINAGKPLIGEKLDKHEEIARSGVMNLIDLAALGSQSAKRIEAVISDRERRSRELDARILRLRLGLLLAVTASGFLFLLRRQRRKHAEASEAVHRHAEQQAKLDRLAYFSSQLAQEHAHEIKQPLTAINAHLYTLQKILTPGTPAYKDAAIIRSEINRLDQIVEKFLKQAKPADFQPVALTAEQAIGEVRDLMTSQLKQQGIELRCELERAGAFCADPRQLKQVLINLVKNAAESISRQGVITLRARPDTRQFEGQTQAVTLIEVEDTGGGIPPEIQARIFDPFFSTKERGSGLGLAISARIIEQHGGRLEFDTSVGQGTIFRIMLPTAEANKSHEQSPAH